MARFSPEVRIDAFDYWLFMIPWRLERYYNMIDDWPMDDSERARLIHQYSGD